MINKTISPININQFVKDKALESPLSFNGVMHTIKNDQEVSMRSSAPEEDVLEINKITDLLENFKKVEVVESKTPNSIQTIDVTLPNDTKRTIDTSNNEDDVVFSVLDSNKDGYKLEVEKQQMYENEPTAAAFAKYIMALVKAVMSRSN